MPRIFRPRSSIYGNANKTPSQQTHSSDHVLAKRKLVRTYGTLNMSELQEKQWAQDKTGGHIIDNSNMFAQKD